MTAKHISIISVCFIALLCVYCDKIEFDNPLDSDGTKNHFNSNIEYGSFKDSRDGRTYRTIKIGQQTWMAENLNYKVANTSWCYNNDTSNCKVYGRLYTWEAAKSACPNNWSLPDTNKWYDLIAAAGGIGAAGRKLRSQNGWYGNLNGIDSLGFSALPAGYRNSNNIFLNAGYYGYWWSASAQGQTSFAYGWDMGYDYGYAREFHNIKDFGFSVRCVR